MPRTFKHYASTSVPGRRQREYANKDETVRLETDWNEVADHASTTLSSSAWTTEDDSLVSLSGDATSGGVSSVTCGMTNIGEAAVKNTATFADGQVRVKWWLINVVDAVRSAY